MASSSSTAPAASSARRPCARCATRPSANRRPSLNTAYLGTSSFAVAVLERLAASAHRPALVITRPDRPRGRGRKLAPPPVAEAARRLGVPVIQPASVNDAEAGDALKAAAPDVVCVCAFGALIREPLLSSYRMLNVHPSLLPRWRGAAPIERAIMAGDPVTGVSIMRVTEGLDSGPVYAQREEPIEPEDTYGSLAGRLERLGGDLLVAALDELPDPTAQPEQGVTYAEKITASDRRLDPDRTADELARVVRALHPHIGAFAELEGERLGVLQARAAPGRGDGHVPALACADGYLLLEVVKPAGKREMAGQAWLRGRHA